MCRLSCLSANHLDLGAVVWLEAYLATYNHILVVCVLSHFCPFFHSCGGIEPNSVCARSHLIPKISWTVSVNPNAYICRRLLRIDLHALSDTGLHQYHGINEQEEGSFI